MSTELTSNRLRSLVLSAVELRQMKVAPGGLFPETFISDYLTLLQNLVLLAEAVDGEILQDLEEINTEFQDDSIPFVFSNLLREDNPNFTWNSQDKLLNINGTITGKNRAKQFFYGGF